MTQRMKVDNKAMEVWNSHLSEAVSQTTLEDDVVLLMNKLSDTYTDKGKNVHTEGIWLNRVKNIWLLQEKTS